MLPRPLVAAALACALAVTSVPAEAQGLDRRVDPEAAAAVLFGLATLAIIANQAQRNKDRDDRRKVDRNPPPVAHAPGPQQRHHAPRVRQMTVPSDCARRVVLDGRQVTGFGAPCLRRAGVDIARLPGACARRVDLGNRAVTGWEARCLHRAGVRIR
jgi:hypothetical protein